MVCGCVNTSQLYPNKQIRPKDAKKDKLIVAPVLSGNSRRWTAFSKIITTKIVPPQSAGTLSPSLLKANPLTSKTAKTKPAPDQMTSKELPSQMGDEVK